MIFASLIFSCEKTDTALIKKKKKRYCCHDRCPIVYVHLQLFAGNDADEFSSILNRKSDPKILITTCRFNSTVCLLSFLLYCQITFDFLHEWRVTFSIFFPISGNFCKFPVFLDHYCLYFAWHAERTCFYIRTAIGDPKCSLL